MKSWYIALLKLARVRAVDIADAIRETLTNLGLSLDDLISQSYDGASTMSGVKSGVQARIQEKQPKAIHTQCAGHSFNLAVLSSCSIPSIRNCIDQIKSLTIFVKKSPKIEERVFLKQLLLRILCPAGHGRTPLLNVCVTRWVENIDGWDRFSTAHPFLVKMCQVILYGDPDYSLYKDNWPAEHKNIALAYLKFLEFF